ncbi:hypothetical protein CKY47_15085 [Saccharothrix yanglingensis]|uniref:Uncharacterized protein n=1 Tax=Saccharothrix yanglingensis TaxID=659496 RepID=A0ABU0WZI2_9PSEU|nr:hypothetical protein [Saccharothrix yanglingensis]
MPPAVWNAVLDAVRDRDGEEPPLPTFNRTRPGDDDLDPEERARTLSRATGGHRGRPAHRDRRGAGVRAARALAGGPEPRGRLGPGRSNPV